MTDHEALGLMAFFFAIAGVCQIWLWLNPRKANATGSESVK